MASRPPVRTPSDSAAYRDLLRDGFAESRHHHCQPLTALDDEQAIAWMRSLEERATADGLRTKRIEAWGPSCVFTYPAVWLTAPDGSGYYKLHDDPDALQQRIERDWGDTLLEARARL